jgi:hypothetical protein
MSRTNRSRGVLQRWQALEAKAAALLDSNFGWSKDFDWDSISRGCEGQLDRTANLIAGDAFSRSLDSVIAAAKAKLNSK